MKLPAIFDKVVFSIRPEHQVRLILTIPFDVSMARSNNNIPGKVMVGALYTVIVFHLRLNPLQ